MENSGKKPRLTGQAMEEASETKMAFKMFKSMYHCSICYLPLKPPVFECRSGHRVCVFCAEYHTHTCYYCFAKYKHIPWLDPCLMAAQVPCPNKRFGCPSSVAYGLVEGHLLECRHGPCRCPDCDFLGSPPMLYGHLKENHDLLITSIAFDIDHDLKLHEAERRRLLATEDGKHLFLLVISERAGGGREIRVVNARAKDFDPWRYWCKAWTNPPVDPENGCRNPISRLEDRARSCPVLSEAAAIAVGGRHLTVHLLDKQPGGGFALTVSITRYQLETAAGATAPAPAAWM